MITELIVANELKIGIFELSGTGVFVIALTVAGMLPWYMPKIAKVVLAILRGK